ncbi:MAG: amidohydrolase [Candidatus Latescibacterota bacterium]|nr:amidohydrolase [Candidatus Latescibacterota bacterium]
MDVDSLKKNVCAFIDQKEKEIINIGETIMDNPELGFKEFNTAQRVCEVFEDLGLPYEDKLAQTGVKARLKGKQSGPTVAIMGELDALILPEHPRADTRTGAAHACGHNAQIAGMLGAAYGLVESSISEQISGEVVFFAVPAEEFVEIEYRSGLVRSGKTSFMAGKPELVALGHFDDIDMALMIHSSSPESVDGSMGLAESSNGFIAKTVNFIGRAAHAGGAPEKGVNALSAAQLSLSAIDAQRSTFRDEDCVRVHPIITRGGSIVNIIPSEVSMETYIRAKTAEGILDAEKKVDRALKGAAFAMGCEVDIETVPGYLPLNNSPGLATLFRTNATLIFGEDKYRDYPHSGGSTDAGDLSQIMPVLHPSMTGAAGTIHGSDWKIANQNAGYLAPAKTLAMMAIDLLCAGYAERILAEESPKMSRDSYLRLQHEFFRSERYNAEGEMV